MNKKTKKIILSGIVLGTLPFFPINNAKAEFVARGDFALSTKEVYAYDRDDFSSEKIGILDVNREVYRILSGENCDLVNCGDYLFFVDKDAIEVHSESQSNNNYSLMDSKGIAVKNVNLRVGPSIDYNKIITLDKGTCFDIIAVCDNSWYLVDYGNLLGFVSSDYVKSIDNNQLELEMSNLPEIYRVVEATTEVNVRSGPSVNDRILTTIPKGYRLSMNKRLDNGWYEVEKNGNIGYLCGDYAKEVYTLNGDCYKIVSMENDANVYDMPYGNVFGIVPKFEACFVYGEVEDFYLVECEGHIGYVLKSDCNILEGTFAIVDISDQQLVVYRGVEELLRTSVVTGKDSTPTTVGLFTISEKASPKVLKGDDYEVKVKYWLRFHNGEGIHDLKRSAYGGEIYHNNGSHGCVNTPLKKMSIVYDLLDKDDNVLVKK